MVFKNQNVVGHDDEWKMGLFTIQPMDCWKAEFDNFTIPKLTSIESNLFKVSKIDSRSSARGD